MNLFKFIKFYLFSRLCLLKPYMLFSLKTLLTTVSHTNDSKYIFKLYLKTCCTGTSVSWTQNLHFRNILRTSQFTPNPALFLIYICHNSGSTYFFIIFSYKGRCSYFKLYIHFRIVINFIAFVGWSQFIMSDHPTHYTKGSNWSYWPPKLSHQGGQFTMMTRTNSQQGRHMVTN